MRLIFVRHGEPDYGNDCLTKSGELQAAACAKRLADEGITEIFSSSNGRAFQTAGYTANELNLPVTKLDYLREISWGGDGIPENGHPWILSNRMIYEENFDFFRDDWRKHPYFENNVATKCYDEVTTRFDTFLCEQGYRHEGNRFFCNTDEEKTIAIFGHGGSCGCVISNIMGLPMPYVFSMLPYEFTSVTIFEFPAYCGTYVTPRLELFNDTAHTKGISTGLVFQRESL